METQNYAPARTWSRLVPANATSWEQYYALRKLDLKNLTIGANVGFQTLELVKAFSKLGISGVRVGRCV